MQRYFAKLKEENKLILQNSDIHHIKNVMRMNVGDKIEVIYNSINYLCEITNLDSFDIKIINIQDENNEMNLDITIAIGLVKEQKMDLILQKLTELGVKRIIPLKMERSIVKLDPQKFAKKKERWNSICKEASEQSHRNVIPEITNQMTIKELAKENFDYKYVCSVKEEDNLIVNYLQNNSKYAKIVFVIGPEGGISEQEETELNNDGYISVSLGKRVLRVETAAIYVASILNYCSMR
jgi:16S rRNA (uracil1498-N3)-methyltransferase